MKNLLTFIALLAIGTSVPSGLPAEEAASVAVDAAAQAQDAESAEGTPSPETDAPAVSAATLLPTADGLPDTASLVTRTALSLMAVILVLWAVVQLLKKFSPGGASSSSNSQIRVLDRTCIAPKKSIYVVQIGGKALALGVSDQQITNLTELDLDETLSQYQTASPGRVTQRFTDVLKTVNARLTRHTEEPAT